MNSKQRLRLSIARPDLCKEWDDQKNSPLTPDDVLFSSKRRVWWKCDNGHGWIARIYRRAGRGDTCPECRRLLGKFISDSKYLMSEWNYEKNLNLDPSNIKMGSNKSVWWKCKYGHEWKAEPNNRKNGCNCPYCSCNKVSEKNSLVCNHPSLIREWDYKKNKDLNPDNFSEGSNKSVWWKCRKCHNSWLAKIVHRTRGSACPFCCGNKVAYNTSFGFRCKRLLREWDFARNKIDPYTISSNSHMKVYWICKRGHMWKASVLNRNQGSGCPHCDKIILKDKTQWDSMVEAYYYLKLKKEYSILKYHRQYPKLGNKNIGRRMYDFYVPSIDTYFEVTSFSDNDFLSYAHYADYLLNISIKRDYVKKILKSNFKFIQRKLSKKERKFLQKYIA